MFYIFPNFNDIYNSTQIWQLKNRLRRARDVLNTPFVWQYQYNYEVAILESVQGKFLILYHSIHWFWRRNFQKTSIINKLEAMVAILVVRQYQRTNLEEDHLSSVTTFDTDQGMAKHFWAFGYGKLKMYMAQVAICCFVGEILSLERKLLIQTWPVCYPLKTRLKILILCHNQNLRILMSVFQHNYW